jgi:outer membrane receptor protein involved in Fe transport
MPANTYDAFLDFAWSPEILPWLSAELGFRTGVYSDFSTFNTHSMRFIGGGMGVVRLSPNLWAKFGAIYLDRASTKLIPAGGIVWKPSDESLWEIVFPRPKISRRLSFVGTTPVWGFVAMDFFGGGSWTIERASGSSDEVEYDDMRVELGLEWQTARNWKFLFEVGYVFNRKLKYVSLMPEEFDPDGSFMLRAGVAW